MQSWAVELPTPGLRCSSFRFQVRWSLLFLSDSEKKKGEGKPDSIVTWAMRNKSALSSDGDGRATPCHPCDPVFLLWWVYMRAKAQCWRVRAGQVCRMLTLTQHPISFLLTSAGFGSRMIAAGTHGAGDTLPRRSGPSPSVFDARLGWIGAERDRPMKPAGRTDKKRFLTIIHAQQGFSTYARAGRRALHQSL